MQRRTFFRNLLLGAAALATPKITNLEAEIAMPGPVVGNKVLLEKFPFPTRDRDMIEVKYMQQTNFLIGRDAPTPEPSEESPVDTTGHPYETKHNKKKNG